MICYDTNSFFVASFVSYQFLKAIKKILFFQRWPKMETSLEGMENKYKIFVLSLPLISIYIYCKTSFNNKKGT